MVVDPGLLPSAPSRGVLSQLGRTRADDAGGGGEQRDEAQQVQSQDKEEQAAEAAAQAEEEGIALPEEQVTPGLGEEEETEKAELPTWLQAMRPVEVVAAAAAAAEAALSSALSRLNVVVERYPDLKATTNVGQLQEELTSTENRVAFSRQAFNDAVTEFNTRCEKFPAKLMAGSFGFHPAELLESTESPEERKAVKVAF